MAVLDFVAFKGITNALGGVEVNNPAAFNSSQLPGRVFVSGEINLNGEEALAFARERYAFSDGDYQRVRNQKFYLKAVISFEDLGLNSGYWPDVLKVCRVCNNHLRKGVVLRSALYWILLSRLASGGADLV